MVQHHGEPWSAANLRNIVVHTICAEELFLLKQCVTDSLGLVDVILRSVHHSNVAQAQRVHFSCEILLCICALVHNIKFCDHTDGSVTIWIHTPRKVKRIAVGKVRICWGYCKDDASGALDITVYHIFDHLLNVVRLISHWHFGDTRKIHQGHGEYILAVDFEPDLFFRDSFVVSHFSICFGLNLIADGAEFIELLSGQV
mmetsp:Transcript_831/g.5187  ORF Transcript_831/g.5187 Transcript_831/m.5187 type:complete len:200 (-) Transcript_831:465-1064(-)